MIEQLPNGKHRVRVYLGGRAIYTKVHETRKAAVNDEASWNARLVRGSWIDPKAGRMPVAKVVDKFLASRPGMVAPKTVITETYLLGLLTPAFKRLPIGIVAATDVQEELQRHSADHSRSTLDRLKSVLSMTFKHAIALRLIEDNPVQGVRTPEGRIDHERAQMYPYTLAELREVSAALTAEHPDGDIALFLGLTGLRWGEMAALRPRDVLRVPYNAVRVTRSLSTSQPVRDQTKTGRDRVVPVPSEAWPVIERRLPGLSADDLIFTTRGRPLGGWAWKSRTRWSSHSRCRRVHDLRHTACTWWLSSGVDPKTAQSWSGHASASMLLERYGHALPGASAVALARLESLLAPSTDTSPTQTNTRKGGRRAR